MWYQDMPSLCYKIDPVFCFMLYLAPFWMKIFMEFNLAFSLRMVKFTILNVIQAIIKIFFEKSYDKRNLNLANLP